jgi:hypothetical protein
MRYFIDEALTFLEAYETTAVGQFVTNEADLTVIRTYAIEFNKRVLDLKHALRTTDGVAKVNEQVEFSTEFKSKRTAFFRKIFKRLDSLGLRVAEASPVSEAARLSEAPRFSDDQSISNNEDGLVKLLSRILLKIVDTTNKFVNLMEFQRWRRSYALDILDKLAVLCNDFAGVFESYSSFLKKKSRVHQSSSEIETSARSSTHFTPLQRSNSRLSNFFGLNGNRSCTRLCPCVFIILAALVLLFFIVLVLPIIRWFMSSSSTSIQVAAEPSIFTFTLSQMQAKPDTDVNQNKQSMFQIFKLPPAFFSQLASSVPTAVAVTSKPSQTDTEWTRIFDYMKDLYIFVASITTFVSFEWLLNR